MSKALELAKFGRETPPTGVVVGDSDLQTLSQKTFADGPVFSSGAVNAVAYLNASKVFSTSGTFVFDGTNLGIGTANPAYKLQLKDGAIGVTSADGTVTSIINYNSLGTVTNSDFVFNTNSTERARISSSGLAVTGTVSSTGNAGIGTAANTDYRLTVARGNESTGQVGLANFRTEATGSATYNAGVQIFGTASATAANRLVSFVMDADGADAAGGNYFYITKTGGDGRVDLIQASNAPMGFAANYVGRGVIDMTLSAAGNLGLGTTPSTGAKFQVTGYTDFWNTTNTLLRVQHDGTHGKLQSYTGGGVGNIVLNPDGGNVGIGVTPQTALQVSGTVRASSGFQIGADKYILQGNQYTGALTANDLVISTASTGQTVIWAADIGQALNVKASGELVINEVGADYDFRVESDTETHALFVDASTSRVGIGTSSPTYKLDVSGSGRFTTGLYVAGTGDLSLSRTDGYDMSIVLPASMRTANKGLVIQEAGGGNIYKFSVSANTTTISGNVGIGTPAPNDKLTVWTTSATGLQTALRLNNPFGFANQNTGTQIVFSQDRSTAEDLKQGIIAVGQNDPGTSATSYMSFYTNNTGLAERLRIDHVGRIIINANQSSNYPAMLDIYGGGGATTLGAIRIGDGTYSSGHVNYWDIGRDNNISGDFTFSLNASEKMRIKTNGNVGIGTTSPYKPLQIKTTEQAAGTYYLATIGGSSHVYGYAVGLGFDPEGYGYRNKIGIIAEGTSEGYSRGKLHIVFHALNNSTEASIADSKVTFLEGGNVGINNTSPEAKLHINGAASGESVLKIAGQGTTNSTVKFADVDIGGQGYGGSYLQWSRDGSYGNDFSVYNRTSGNSSNKTFNIDLNGRVTMPYKPAWCLRPNSGGNAEAGNSVIGWTSNTSGTSGKATFLNGVTLTGSSSGIHNATSTGRLTVPVAGKYKIWVTIRGENFPNNGNIYLDVNGSNIARQHVEVWGPTSGYPYGHGFLSMILDLSANDFIEVRVAAAGLIVSGYNDTVNWFSGELIG